MAELSYAQVSALLKYDSETGKLYWLPRPVEMCPSQQEANRWNSRFAGKEAFISLHHTGYLKGAILNIHFRAHRICWLLHYRSWPENSIDHINGDKTDNRIENLRDVTCAENHKNQRMRSNNTSGFRGVYWNKNMDKWQSYIRENGRSKHLGVFTEFEEAVKSRLEAERRLGYHPNHGRN